MGKKKLSAFRTFLALMSNQNGNIRLGFGPRFLMDPNPEPNGTGTPAPTPTPEPNPNPNADGSYPKEFVEKLLREKNNWRDKAKLLEAEKNTPSPAPTPSPNPSPAPTDDFKAMLKAEQDKNKALQERLEAEENTKKEAMRLGALKREFLKNGGDDKTFELVAKLATVDKILIDEDTGIVYGADEQIRKIKETAPQLFGKAKRGTDQTDMSYNNSFDKDSTPEDFVKGRRNKTDPKTGANPLVDFYASHGITLKK